MKTLFKLQDFQEKNSLDFSLIKLLFLQIQIKELMNNVCLVKCVCVSLWVCACVCVCVCVCNQAPEAGELFPLKTYVHVYLFIYVTLVPILYWASLTSYFFKTQKISFGLFLFLHMRLRRSQVLICVMATTSIESLPVCLQSKSTMFI